MGIVSSLPVQRVKPVLALPLWLGTLRDHSGYGNHAIPAGGYWANNGNMDGHVVPTFPQRLTVSDSPELQTSGHVSIFVWGYNRTHPLATAVAKSDGGGTNYEFYLSTAAGGSICTWDGAGVSTFAYNVVGSKSLAVTMENGTVPVFYVDGVFVGVGGAVAAVTANNAPLDIGALYVGNPWQNSISGVLIYTDTLTAPEILSLHTWSQQRFTPRKQWPGGGLDIPTLAGTAQEPKYLDNFQTAQVSLVDVLNGPITNTGYHVHSGTFALREDEDGRWLECLATGMAKTPISCSGSGGTLEIRRNGASWLALKDAAPPTEINLVTGDQLRNINCVHSPLYQSQGYYTWTTTDVTQNRTIRIQVGEAYWIDWGDGILEAFTGTGVNQAIAHNYTAAGTYTIGFLIETNAALVNFVCSANSLTGNIPDLSANAALAAFSCSANSLTGNIPDLSANAALTGFYCSANSLTGYTASVIAATCTMFRAENNALDLAAVDQILTDFTTGAGGRPGAGTINLSGGTNATPTAAVKNACVAALPGWAITTN